MAYYCSRCKKIVDRLITIGDVEATAYISSEEHIPMPQFEHYCPDCVMEVLQIETDRIKNLRYPEDTEVIGEIEVQKNLMISVSTGGPRIQEKNQEYKDRRIRLKLFLQKRGLPDPNPYNDLWSWYGKWSNGDLPTYKSRRIYISELYKPLLDSLSLRNIENRYEPVQEPTGWARVDRGIDGIRISLESATNEEENQVVGLLCRETLISLAQAVYNPLIHKSSDGITPSSTDASRMLDSYFSTELEGRYNETARRHAKAALSLANDLQHRRTATFKDAALCTEATRTVINIVAIISGRKNP